MLNDFKKMKWFPIAVGAVLCLLGLTALLWPQRVANVLPMSVGAGLLALGLSSLWEGFLSRRAPGSYGVPRMVLGAVNVAAGLVFLFNRRISLVFLAAVLGVGMLIAGVLRLCGALRRRAAGEALWGPCVADAVLKCLVGAAMLLSPLGSMAVWTVLVGVFFLFTGVSVIVSALYLDRTFHDFGDF